MKQVMSFNYSVKYCTALDNFGIKSTADNCGIISGCTFSTYRENIGKGPCADQARYSIFDIADWFLSKGNMTHKKLQKLCYYAQAWCFALRDYPLANTDFQAWCHGPVSPALYERFKGFGYETIKMSGTCTLTIAAEDEQLLDDVWDTYGDMTGNALEALSHRELPWIEARKGYGENERCSVIITPASMKDYYRSIYLK